MSKTVADASRVRSTVADLSPNVRDGGRSADTSSVWHVGGSTTVWVLTCTAVDLPPIRCYPWWMSGHGLCGLPDDGRSTTATRRRDVGRSTTVTGEAGQIDHRHGGGGADRPPSRRTLAGPCPASSARQLAAALAAVQVELTLQLERHHRHLRVHVVARRRRNPCHAGHLAVAAGRVRR